MTVRSKQQIFYIVNPGSMRDVELHDSEHCAIRALHFHRTEDVSAQLYRIFGGKREVYDTSFNKWFDVNDSPNGVPIKVNDAFKKCFAVMEKYS